MADGEYELDHGKTINTITIIGDSSQNTVVKFQNKTSVLSSNTKFTLENLTLTDVSVVNYGTLKATNVIFRDSIGYEANSAATNLVNSASNSFGGAIYSYYDYYSTPSVYIDNCTFINNTAEYGGAIYMYGGVLDIKRSYFYNNYAYNYGGAIACEYNSKANIEKTKFVNCTSINDAGGAIYLKSSKLIADNITIENSTGTFGSAITSLDTTLTVNLLNASNNIAKYEGGAIYQFYGTLTLRNSNFINNSAKNGGALFVDNTTSTIFYQNTFINNTALEYGGAIYSLLNVKVRDNYGIYVNNTARIENDFYNTSTISLVIGSGNYTMYKNNSTFIGELPSNYSSLANGYVTSVKDQQSGGNCWAFAGIAVLESCILKASGDNLDLSEENMKNLMEIYSDYGWEMDTNEGGYPSMVMGYLTSWMGPILEEDDINDDYSTLSPLLNSIMHVQNIKYITRSSYTDNDEIKRAVLIYGAVGTGIYYDSSYFNAATNAYYCSSTTSSNHAVAIVGWDDNYSRNNFVGRPSGDGAFLVKNSWNTDWGDEGYFYVSYYDTSFARIKDEEASYVFILNDTIKYDKNYQYDIQGKTDYFMTGSKNVWYQNIFNATDNEYLAAVSTYFEKECSWNLFIYLNDELALSKNGTGHPGYYKIDLGKYISLNAGDIFKVLFKITSSSATFPISEKVSTNKVVYSPGISFFSTDGKKWIDLYDYSGSYSSHTYSSQVACIKAFTFIDEIASDITLNITNHGFNPVNIVAKVVNQYGNLVTGGNVIFTINGMEQIVEVINGFANLTVDLEELATSTIEASFNCPGYLSSNISSNVTVNKKTANLDLEVIQHAVTTTINVNISKMINETILISINDENYTVNSTDGQASLVLKNLESGNYTVKAFILNDVYVNTEAYADFSIDVKPTQILAGDLISYYYSGSTYTMSLVDSFGSPVVDREVLFTINGRSFKKFTDSNGKASITITLKNGQYDLNISFNGDEKYINSSKTVNVIVKSTIMPSELRNYTLNSNYSITLLDKNGKVLKNTVVSVNVDGTLYNLTSDDSEIMIMDEVLAVGDMAFQRKCLTKMKEAATQEGRTVLYVSHNMNTIRQLCERCIVLDKGRVIFEGDVEEAINAYLGQTKKSPSFVDLTDRVYNPEYLEGIKLTGIEAVDRDTWMTTVGEKLQFNIYAQATKDLQSVGYRMRLFSTAGTSVSVLVAKDLINCSAGEKIKIPLEADISELVPGKYQFTPCLYHTDHDGSFQFYDHIHAGVTLEVTTSNEFNQNMNWDAFYWGHVKLPELKDLRNSSIEVN